MSAIPVTVSTFCSVVNLPEEMENKNLFSEHEKLVMDYIERYSDGASYALALSDEGSMKLHNAFSMAYCFKLLESTAEFLNLNTLGQGIIKTTGMDQLSTELLTGEEIQRFKQRLEIRSLEAIKDYLNEDGKKILYLLKPSIASARNRARMI